MVNGFSEHSTIFALSSGSVPSGVAIVRVSGPQSRFAVETICERFPIGRKPVLTELYRPCDGSVIDKGLVFYWQGPRSFTGEDVAEFHIHGGRAVVTALLDVLSDFDGCRMAEPGEFSRRAFLNEKIDLLESEGLADLINADTELQRRQAFLQLSGAPSETYEAWRTTLIRLRSLLEAELDFADEDDVPGSVSDRVWEEVRTLDGTIESVLKNAKRAERVRDGVTVVLTGPPNAGKSSLMNAISKRNVAIVSSQAGTTRDILEVFLDLEGVPIRLLDTAGIRDGGGEVERIGIQRALAAIDRADLIVELQDVDGPLVEKTNDDDKRKLLVGNKIDLISDENLYSIRERYDQIISLKTGDGIEPLLDTILMRCRDLADGIGEEFVVTQSRHRGALADVRKHLSAAFSNKQIVEIAAEELRGASDCLGRVTGRTDVEDILDRIFSDFCIGK